jgi:3-phenylpropionate/trans-cinnamate dioxygenase ferredoxin reductase subunit
MALMSRGAVAMGMASDRVVAASGALREELARAERVAIVGGSYIATELAASLTALGKHCELIMLESVTLERPFGADVGRFFQDVLEQHGVVVHGTQELARFEGGGGRVTKVVTGSGLELECDFVALGAGVHPELRLAEHAGLAADGAIPTDRYLETSAPGVFAAGDVAAYDSVLHGGRVRIEHWDVAFNQGRVAALNMLDKGEPYDVVPYFWSDLADWTGMEYVGAASDWDEVWWRGGAADGEFSAWYVKDGRLVAAISVGRSEDLAAAAALLRERAEVAGKRELIEDLDSDVGALA